MAILQAICTGTPRVATEDRQRYSHLTLRLFVRFTETLSSVVRLSSADILRYDCELPLMSTLTRSVARMTRPCVVAAEGLGW
jgi:hypothetical protein